MSYTIRKVEDTEAKQITCGLLKSLFNEKDFDKLDIAHVTVIDSTKKHYHPELTEFYYVLKGKLKIELDGKEEILEKGSIIMIPPNTHHKAFALEGSAELLVICSPPWTEEGEKLSP